MVDRVVVLPQSMQNFFSTGALLPLTHALACTSSTPDALFMTPSKPHCFGRSHDVHPHQLHIPCTCRPAIHTRMPATRTIWPSAVAFSHVASWQKQTCSHRAQLSTDPPRKVQPTVILPSLFHSLPSFARAQSATACCSSQFPRVALPSPPSSPRGATPGLTMTLQLPGGTSQLPRRC